MTVAKARLYKSFEAYLAADPSLLPEGRFEYWDGALIPVMSESIWNDEIANYLLVLLMQAGVNFRLIRPHSCEISVPGKPRTRFPDLVILDETHLALLARRATITDDMPPPQVVMEVVSPGDENSTNYQRDYEEKRLQYAARGIPEYWIIDPDRQCVLVLSLAGEAYKTQRFNGDQLIASATFPELRLSVETILRAGQS
jgi:Uma2 family endonuclease